MDIHSSLDTNILELSKLSLIDSEDRAIPVHKFWQDQTSIFIFVRHFACIECRAFVKDFWEKREQYEASGGKMIFVGNGTPNFIDGFKDELNVKDAPVYTDPSLHVFRAAGFKRGFLAAMGPQALANIYKLSGKGYKSGYYKKEMGDLWQLGGVLVINTEGKVVYRFVSQKFGDLSPEKDFVKPRNRPNW